MFLLIYIGLFSTLKHSFQLSDSPRQKVGPFCTSLLIDTDLLCLSVWIDTGPLCMSLLMNRGVVLDSFD